MQKYSAEGLIGLDPVALAHQLCIIDLGMLKEIRCGRLHCEHVYVFFWGAFVNFELFFGGFMVLVASTTRRGRTLERGLTCRGAQPFSQMPRANAHELVEERQGAHLSAHLQLALSLPAKNLVCPQRSANADGSPQDTIASHVVNVVQWFNKFSRWVMSEICNWSDAAQRALCIKFFLRCAFLKL